MKLEFLNDCKIGKKLFEKGKVVIDNSDNHFEELNDKYIMLIMNGIRYDIKKDLVKIS